MDEAPVIRVRRGAPGEEEALRALRIAALTDAPGAFGSTLARERERTVENLRGWFTGGVVFLLEVDGADRGLIAGVPDDDGDPAPWLVSMWLHPDHRGAGHADRLMIALIGWARDLGAPGVRLRLADHNARARKLYERHGFAATGRTEPHPKGWVEVEMRLDLGDLRDD